MGKLAIIDIDGMFYHSSKETLQESIESFDERMLNLFEKTGATYFVAFYSNKPYFRNKVYPEYKIQRKFVTSTLKWLKSLKAYAIENYGASKVDNIEADDLAALLMNNELYTVKLMEIPNFITIHLPTVHDDYDIDSKVLCSPDKDLLKSIPGKHFNYTFKAIDENTVEKGHFVETEEIDALKFNWYQMLIGDTSDSVLGCARRVEKVYKTGAKKGQYYYAREGIKPKTAELLLTEQYTEKQMAKIVFEEYLSLFGIDEGIHRFQSTFRALRLLKTHDAAEREEITIPYSYSPKLVSEFIHKEIEENPDSDVQF